MRDYIEERIYQAAAYIIENGATVRDAAKVLKISKSTVHKVVKSGKTCMGAIKFADVNGELLSAQRRSPDIPLEYFHNLGAIGAKGTDLANCNKRCPDHRQPNRQTEPGQMSGPLLFADNNTTFSERVHDRTDY